jgi:hypothetical protein
MMKMAGTMLVVNDEDGGGGGEREKTRESDNTVAEKRKRRYREGRRKSVMFLQNCHCFMGEMSKLPMMSYLCLYSYVYLSFL